MAEQSGKDGELGKKKVAEKRPEGRPTKYDPKYCDMLIEHLKKGLSFEVFATDIGCCRRSLYEWVDRHPEFMHAKNVGTEWSQRFWEELGLKGIVGSTELAFYNASTYIFTMKNRFKWLADQKQEIKQEVKSEATNKVTMDSNVLKAIEALKDAALSKPTK